MTYRVTVTLGNLNPVSDGLDINAFSTVWEEAECLFQDRQHLDYKVSIDASDVMQFYKRRKGFIPDKKTKLFRHSKGFPGRGVRLLVTFKGDELDEWARGTMTERFLENLYLAMNLAVPGSCNLYRGRFRRKTSLATQGYISLDLCTDALHFAYATAAQHGWPVIHSIRLSKVWEWLEATGALKAEVAREPIHRALFTFLRLGYTDSHNIDNIRLCVQAIESLLGGGAPARLVQERVESVIGSPKSHKSWYSDLYSIRSKVVHGSAPILRPGSWLNENEAGGVQARYFGHVDQAYVVLLALIQALITNGSRNFRIDETVTLF